MNMPGEGIARVETPGMVRQHEGVKLIRAVDALDAELARRIARMAVMISANQQETELSTAFPPREQLIEHLLRSTFARVEKIAEEDDSSRFGAANDCL
jgi:glycerol-3-phosphate O-acyltransferase